MENTGFNYSINSPCFFSTCFFCWIPNSGVPCSKPLGGSKVDSALDPYEFDQMSTRNFWELSGKK